MVSNAGRSQRGRWDAIEVEVDYELFQLNVFSTIVLARHVNRYFRQVGAVIFYKPLICQLRNTEFNSTFLHNCLWFRFSLVISKQGIKYLHQRFKKATTLLCHPQLGSLVLPCLPPTLAQNMLFRYLHSNLISIGCVVRSVSRECVIRFLWNTSICF